MHATDTPDTLFPELVILDARRVYFGLGENFLIKIGTTSRPNGRRGGEMHFAELCSVRGGRSVESYYHGKYAAEKIGKTEWFNPSDRLLLDLIVMCTEQGRAASAETVKMIVRSRLQQAAA